MTWVAQLNQTYGDTADFIEDAVNGIHKVLTDAGWTTLDELNATSGQTDRVYYSAGEDGTEKIYFRMYQVTGTEYFRFETFTFWDAVSHTGYNKVGNAAAYPFSFKVLSRPFPAWIIANKDGLTLSWTDVYATTEIYGSIFYIGVPTRSVASNRAGRTTLTSGVTVAAGGSTALAVASESNIQTGQKVRVLNQTAGANAGNFVRCTVTATATNQITVTNDATTALSFDSGALVGHDPCPIIMLGSTYNYGQAVRSVPSKGAVFIYGMDTEIMTGTAIALSGMKQYYVVTQQGLVTGGSLLNETSSSSTNLWENNAWQKQDPGFEGTYSVYPFILVGGISNNVDNADHGLRATTERVAWVTRGLALSSLDVIETGATTRFLCTFQDTNYVLYQYSTVFKIAE